MAKIKIGDKYLVVDNSQQKCFYDGKNHHLAGSSWNNLPQQSVKVMSLPFRKKYKFIGKVWENDFIIGKCDKGFLHLIMYFETNEHLYI